MELTRTLRVGGTLYTALLAWTSQGAAQNVNPTLTTIHSFSGQPGDGSNPWAGVVLGDEGVLYGTTQFGGSFGAGTVFSLMPPASPGGAWAESVLYSFMGGEDGATPIAAVTVGNGGALYGTATGGGTSNWGTVFSLTPPANSGEPWAETVLHTFTAKGSDGAQPSGQLVIGTKGVLYGVTYEGGLRARGTAFSLRPPSSPGGAWIQNVIHSFGGSPDGANPRAGFTIGPGPVFYGTTAGGGSSNCGTVYSLAPPVSAGDLWTETILHSFLCGTDGIEVEGGVAIDHSGVLYGTTQGGGKMSVGTVFSLTPPSSPGAPWTETVIYNFSPSSGGQNPRAGVVIGRGGVLYGTTSKGGQGKAGTVYALLPPAAPGGSWTYQAIHAFPGTGDDGAFPYYGSLLIGPDGIYGTTDRGGTSGQGTVFSVTP